MIYWYHVLVCVLDLQFTLQWPRHKMAIAMVPITIMSSWTQNLKESSKLQANWKSHLIWVNKIWLYFSESTQYQPYSIMCCVVVGINISLASLYLAEISPKQIRGAVGTCHQLFITVGILWSNIMGTTALFGKFSGIIHMINVWWPVLVIVFLNRNKSMRCLSNNVDLQYIFL